MNENYGDDLRRELQKLRDDMGIDPDKSGLSGKKSRPSRRAEKAPKVVPARVTEEPLLVTNSPSSLAVEDKGAANPTSDIRVETSSPKPEPKAAPPQGGSSKSGSKKVRRGALIGAGVFLVAASTYGYVRFDFVTATQGIDTTLGESADRAIVIDTVDDVSRTDLVAAILPFPAEDGSDAVLIGTVFSENTETVAVYDGEVIWQIPVDDILGTVLFATATESL